MAAEHLHGTVRDLQRDPLHLVVEIKGYRREDAKEKKATMETYWVPGVNSLGSYGRWSFAEFTQMYTMTSDLAEEVEHGFEEMMEKVASAGAPAVGED